MVCPSTGRRAGKVRVGDPEAEKSQASADADRATALTELQRELDQLRTALDEARRAARPAAAAPCPYADILFDQENHPDVVGHFTYNANLLNVDHPERIQNSHRVADDVVVQSLPMFRVAAGSAIDCGICQEGAEQHQLVRTLPCAHTYHANCIDRSLLRQRGDCPLCRRPVVKQT